MECCIVKPLSSSIIFYNITSIAYNHHTDIPSFKHIYLHMCSHPSRTVSPSVLAGRGDSSGDEGVGKGDSDDEDEEGEPAVDIAFLTFHNIIGGSR